MSLPNARTKAEYVDRYQQQTRYQLQAMVKLLLDGMTEAEWERAFVTTLPAGRSLGLRVSAGADGASATLVATGAGAPLTPIARFSVRPPATPEGERDVQRND